jgi:hypothetical protein
VLSLSKHERSGTAVVKPSPALFDKRAARLLAWGQYVPARCVRAPKQPQKALPKRKTSGQSQTVAGFVSIKGKFRARRRQRALPGACCLPHYPG